MSSISRKCTEQICLDKTVMCIAGPSCHNQPPLIMVNDKRSIKTEDALILKTHVLKCDAGDKYEMMICTTKLSNDKPRI